ncbi:amidohydrolase family protein [Sorangium sp. So ce1000]|uniref:amidohydrolase family protein n=1 Tax=Sorangium sp. So ce1000 TaxID=3133325 RepID=UPI003F6005F5
MKDGFSILDADSHVIEPHAVWRGVAKKFQHVGFEYSPTYPDGSRRYVPFTLQGSELTHLVTQRLIELAEGSSPYPEVWTADGMSPEFHANTLKDRGADQAVVFPTFGLWMWSVEGMDPGLAGALVQAYNDWLLDYCARASGFLKPAVAVNLHAPELLVAELERLVARGASTVFVRPNPVGGRMLGDAAYEPFWAACERLDVSVGVHEGSHSRLSTIGSDRFTKRFAVHACSHPMEQMMAFLSLLESGVLERHPKLRVAFLESGCGWLPYWLWRLDEEYEQLGWEVEDTVRMPPSDYFRRQCYIAWEPKETCLQQVIDCVGEDRILCGSDFPHVDSDRESFSKMLAGARAISDDFARKLAWDNPKAFYRL